MPNQNSWNYDTLGSWLAGNGASNTFNAQNEETTNGSSTLAYDNAGDMTTDEIGNAYIYDGWGHVVQIKNSAGTSLETFQFDALGRNDVANNNGSNVRQTYDAAGRQIEAAFGTVYAQQVWGLAYVNDIVVRDRDADGNLSTGNLGITGSGLEEREYAQHDKQFSVISLTNQTGSIIQRIAYDPYGKFTVLTATWTYDSTGGGTNYWFVLFQGMSFVADGSSGNLLQSQTRLYDTNLGRWNAPDWAGYAGANNRYEFVRSSPSAHLDPRGTCTNGCPGASLSIGPERVKDDATGQSIEKELTNSAVSNIRGWVEGAVPQIGAFDAIVKLGVKGIQDNNFQMYVFAIVVPCKCGTLAKDVPVVHAFAADPKLTPAYNQGGGFTLYGVSHDEWERTKAAVIKQSAQDYNNWLDKQFPNCKEISSYHHDEHGNIKKKG